MLIRVAIATEEKANAETLTNELISYSLGRESEDGDVDFDIAFYRDLPKLLSAYADVDIAFFSYDLLEKYRASLFKFHDKNPRCWSVPTGSPDGRICRYLLLRPAGHLSRLDDRKHIAFLCEGCAKEGARRNDVLQIHTKKGSYAVSAASVLYCQSDLKTVTIVVSGGTVYRKSGKLDEVASSLPDFFLRVHQSFLVNLRHVKGLDKTNHEICLDNGERIPVSRAYQKTVSEMVKNAFSGSKNGKAVPAQGKEIK